MLANMNLMTDSDDMSSEVDPQIKELRINAKGRFLTLAQDLGILDTVADDYQTALLPDLERTIRTAQSMGLLVEVVIKPAPDQPQTDPN